MSALAAIPFTNVAISERSKEAAFQLIAGGQIGSLGPTVAVLEDEIASAAGRKFGLAIQSETAALHLILRSLNIPLGCLIAFPDFAPFEGVHALSYEHLSPIFIGCGPQSWTMSAEFLADALEAHCDRVGAVVAADVFGEECDRSALKKICSRHNLPLIIHADNRIRGVARTSLSSLKGLAEIYSLSALTSEYASGAVVASDDAEMLSRARYLASAARMPEPHYEHIEIGYNYRLSAVTAAIAVGQLADIEWESSRRKSIFECYVKGLVNIPKVEIMRPKPSGTYWDVIIWLANDLGCEPSGLVNYLGENGISAQLMPQSLHSQSMFRGCHYFGGEATECRRARAVRLPSGSSLCEQDVDYVVECVAHWIALQVPSATE